MLLLGWKQYVRFMLKHDEHIKNLLRIYIHFAGDICMTNSSTQLIIIISIHILISPAIARNYPHTAQKSTIAGLFPVVLYLWLMSVCLIDVWQTQY